MAKRNTASKTAVWVLLGLLILGLAGFGATNLSGNIRTIGTAGDKPIPVDDYFRLLQQEIRAVEQRSGQTLPFAQAQQIGLDRAVLQRLVATRSLDHETAELGLSIGDEELRSRILQIPAFQGLNGEFDREGYRFALEQAGLSETAFEMQLREEVSRTIVQGAVLGGVTMPAAYVETLVNYVGEQRSFTWSLLDGDDLSEPIQTPDDATLRAHYDANIDFFSLPETKKITYAWLIPDDLVDQVEIDDTALLEAYEQRSDEFNQPARRLVERLAFLDTQSAEAAAASLETGTSFDALVEGRGLTLNDVDLGDVSEADLGDAGAAVFAAAIGDVVGPFPSGLGPALFRVNAILAAQETPFEDAVEILRPEIAADRARRLVEAQAERFDDLLAGGATLEDLAAETDMNVGSIDWDARSTEGIAAYDAFREVAARVGPDDFPEIESLDDGGLFALRLNEVLPPRPAPFDDIREAVIAHWTSGETAARLAEQLGASAAQLETGNDFAAIGLDAFVEDKLLRSDFVPRTPPGFMDAVFSMSPGEVRVIESEAAAILVRLDGVSAPERGGDAERIREQLSRQASQQLSGDIFEAYAADVVRRADPQINPQALQAVHVNFP